jgi:N-acyl-L-homoserine lactone synthetase
MVGVGNKSSAEEFRCDVVTGPDIERAIEIRRQVYIEELGFDLGGAGPSDSLDDRAIHLLATTASGEAVGSLRFIDASARPFEIEAFLDLSPYISPARHPAEITRLCVIAPYRRITRAAFVHLAILEAVLRLARRLGVTDFVASTRSDLMAFYTYLLFETHPEAVYHHPEIGDALHTLVCLDLTTVAKRYRLLRPTLYRAVVAAYLGDETAADSGAASRKVSKAS